MNSGYRFSAVQATFSNGSVDKNASGLVFASLLSGMPVEIRMTACRGKNASAIVKEVISSLQILNANWTRLWV